tara:strand:+ start:208 stop:1536 length:1329 start_codon:yes stop_codon:yes gene_type:complete
MASEIRVDKINSLSGVGTVTLSPTGVDIAGITTAATLRATTGIVTSLTAGSLTSLGAVSGTTGTFSGAVSGTTGTFTGDVDIADKIVHTGDTDTAIRFSGADTITAETGGSERLRIDSGGRLIQRYSAAPYDNRAATFQAPAGQTSTYIAVVNTETNGASGILFGDHAGQNSGNFDAYINYSHQYQHMQFLVGSGTERLRITSTGKVNIGDTQMSSNLLNIEDGTAAAIDIASHGSGGDTAYIGVKKSAGGGLTFGISNRDIIFKTGASYSSGTTFDSGNEKLRLLSAGGLTFNGDTAAANALDDYEEGEYTPTLSNGQTFHSSAYDSLRYTKIGRQVTITGQLVFQAYNSSNFNTTFTIGLPFNNGDGGDRSEYLFHAGVAYFNPSGSSSPSSGYQSIGFYAAANSSHVSVFAIDPNTDTTIGNWVGAGSDVWVNLTYFTN